MTTVHFLESTAGRITRVAVGLVLIALGLALGGWWLVVAAVGLLPLATGVMGVCLVSGLLNLTGHGPDPV